MHYTFAHYPSWGFETYTASQPEPQRSRLITPHGDLKPPTASILPIPASPHYPSWGFETVAQRLGRKSICIDSLPLMGI